MWPVPSSDPVVWCASDSVLRCAKTAERIKIMYKIETLGDPHQSLQRLEGERGNCVPRAVVTYRIIVRIRCGIRQITLFLCWYRRVSGLVGPRALVARQELLVATDAFDAGPVRRASRRPARLHYNAQEHARSTARLTGRRYARQFLVRCLHCRRQTLQRVRSVLQLHRPVQAQDKLRLPSSDKSPHD